jgi:hypothetical protein
MPILPGSVLDELGQADRKGFDLSPRNRFGEGRGEPSVFPFLVE